MWIVMVDVPRGTTRTFYMMVKVCERIMGGLPMPRTARPSRDLAMSLGVAYSRRRQTVGFWVRPAPSIRLMALRKAPPSMGWVVTSMMAV